MSLRASPSKLRGNNPLREHRHELDFLDEHRSRLVCMSCRQVPVVLMIPAGRASTLRTLRDRGELRGVALAESNGGTNAADS